MSSHTCMTEALSPNITQSGPFMHTCATPIRLLSSQSGARRAVADFKLAPTSDLQTLPIFKFHTSTPPSHHSRRTMFLQRTATALARRSPARAITLAQRPFSSSIVRSNEKKFIVKEEGKTLSFDG
ncbi:Cytochrome c oxidase subunit Vb [Penicillium tannophilum]|nr:Cytochrome c oxidase subunit Vb [Penicillium tannophilum]